MKEERGITLGSLVIYVIVMILVIVVMSSVSAMFYNNVNELDARSTEISKIKWWCSL